VPQLGMTMAYHNPPPSVTMRTATSGLAENRGLGKNSDAMR
jgi:hypothetical protein